MTSRLTNRLMKMEKRTAPVDLEKWRRTPVREMPDWVLCTIILDRPVSPAEADRLNKDDEFWRRFELLCAIGEENDEFNAMCGDLIDYVERIQHRARPPVGSTKRAH